MLITNSQNQIVDFNIEKKLEIKEVSIEEFNERRNNKDNSNLNFGLSLIPYNSKLNAIKNNDYLSNNMRDLHYSNARLNIGLALENNGKDPATVNIKGIEGSLIFDLNQNSKIDSISENLDVGSLFALDSNRDGLLDSNDEYFDKLQIVMKDKNSEYKMVELSKLVSFVNLEDYVDKEKVKIVGKTDNVYVDNLFLEYIDPKYTYDRVSNRDLDGLFEDYADEDGWLRLDGEQDLRDIFKDLAYEKKDIDGNSYLQRFQSNYYEGNFDERFHDSIGSSFTDKNSSAMNYLGKHSANQQNLSETHKERFLNLYEEYISAINSNDPLNNDNIALEREFERITNLDFSMENLEKVKASVDSGNFRDTFKDIDTIVGIKKDKDGSYLLEFDTGRTISVDELFSNTGDFLTMNGDKNKRVSITFDSEMAKLDSNSDNKIDEKEIDFENFAIKMDSKMQTLKEAGVKAINIYKENEKLLLELEFLDGETKGVDTFYKIMDLSKSTKIESQKELEAIVNHPYQNRLEDTKGLLFSN